MISKRFWIVLSMHTLVVGCDRTVPESAPVDQPVPVAATDVKPPEKPESAPTPAIPQWPPLADSQHEAELNSLQLLVSSVIPDDRNSVMLPEPLDLNLGYVLTVNQQMSSFQAVAATIDQSRKLQEQAALKAVVIVVGKIRSILQAAITKKEERYTTLTERLEWFETNTPADANVERLKTQLNVTRQEIKSLQSCDQNMADFPPQGILEITTAVNKLPQNDACSQVRTILHSLVVPFTKTQEELESVRRQSLAETLNYIETGRTTIGNNLKKSASQQSVIDKKKAVLQSLENKEVGAFEDRAEMLILSAVLRKATGTETRISKSAVDIAEKYELVSKAEASRFRKEKNGDQLLADAFKTILFGPTSKSSNDFFGSGTANVANPAGLKTQLSELERWHADLTALSDVSLEEFCIRAARLK